MKRRETDRTVGPRLDIVELDLRHADIRHQALHERDSLSRQLRLSREKEKHAFDQGFASAVDMMLQGATLERLLEMVRPGAVPVVARGTVDFDDTQPNSPLAIARSKT